MVSLESSRRRRVIIAFDPIDSDLPVRVAFPLLIHNAVAWLANKNSDAQVQIQAGDTLHLENGIHVVHGPLTASGSGQKFAVDGDFHPTRNGFYRIENGQEQKMIAVNTFDPAQSDLRSIGLPEPSGRPRFGLRSSVGCRGHPGYILVCWRCRSLDWSGGCTIDGERND